MVPKWLVESRERIIKTMKEKKKNYLSLYEVALYLSRSVSWAMHICKLLATAYPEEFEYENGKLIYKKAEEIFRHEA